MIKNAHNVRLVHIRILLQVCVKHVHNNVLFVMTKIIVQVVMMGFTCTKINVLATWQFVKLMDIMVLEEYVCYVNSHVRLVQGRQLIVHHVFKDTLILTINVWLNVHQDISVTRQPVNAIFVHHNAPVV